MINRILLRIKVIQILYAYYKGEDQDFDKAESELQESINKTYDLYYYLLMLMPALTKYAEERAAKEAEFAISAKFVNNKLSKQVAESKVINEYAEENALNWDSKKHTVLKSLLDDIVSSEIYTAYNDAEENSYDADKDFWKKIYKQVIASNEVLGKDLEDESIYWNADEETVMDFVVKTVKKYQEEAGAEQEMQPMYADEEGKEFVDTLFRNAIYNASDYSELINAKIDTKKWDLSRIAFMDRLIMQVAIAELMSFPSIPVNVTLNEYIEIAKNYSGDKSNTFVNGVLDAVVDDLRKQGKLIKVAMFTPNKK